jgi:hypothetical protein
VHCLAGLPQNSRNLVSPNSCAIPSYHGLDAESRGARPGLHGRIRAM